MKKINVKLLLIVLVVCVILGVVAILAQQFQQKRNVSQFFVDAERLVEEEDFIGALQKIGSYIGARGEEAKGFIEKGRIHKLHADFIGTEDLGLYISEIRSSIRAYETGLLKDFETEDEQSKARLELIEIAEMTQQFDLAQEHLEILLKELPSDTDPAKMVDLRYRLGRAVSTTSSRDAANILGKLIGYNTVTEKFDDKALGAKDAQSHVFLASLYKNKLLDEEKADAIFKELLRRIPDDPMATRSYGQYLIAEALGDKEKIAEGKKYILDSYQNDKKNPEAILAAAQAHMQGNTTKEEIEANLKEASKLLEEGLAIEENKLEPVMKVMLARVLLAQDKRDEAIKLTEKAVEDHPGNRIILGELITMKIDDKQQDDIGKLLKAYREAGASEQVLNYFRGRVAFNDAKWPEAINKMKGLQDHFIKDPRRWPVIMKVLAISYLQLNRQAKAKDILEQYIQARPGDTWAIQQLASVYSKMNMPAKANEMKQRLKMFNEKAGPEVVLRALNDSINKQLQTPKTDRNWDEVMSQFAAIQQREDIPEATQYLWYVKILKAQGKNAQAYATARGAVNKYSDYMPLIYETIDLIADQQDVETALASLEKMKEKFGDTAMIRVKKGQLLARQKGPDVKEELRRLEENVAGFTEAERLALWGQLSVAYTSLADHKNAQRLRWKIAGAQPQNFLIRQAIFEIALLANDQKVMDDVLSEMETIVGADSSTLALFRAKRMLARIQRNELDISQLDKVTELVEKVAEDRPDWKEVVLMQAQIAKLLGDTQKYNELMETVADKGRIPMRQLREVIGLMIQQGRLAEAKKQLEKLTPSQLASMKDLQILSLLTEGKNDQALVLAKELTADSEDPRAFLQLAQVYAKMNKGPEAEGAYRKAIELQPGNIQSRMNLIRLLAALKRSDEAQSEAFKLLLLLPEKRVPLVMGQCYAMMGDFMQARRYYQLALDNDPDNRQIIQTVARFYMTSGDIKQAFINLDKLLAGATPHAKSAPSDVLWARRAKALVLARLKDTTKRQAALPLIDQNTPAGEQISPQDFAAKLAILTGWGDVVSQQQSIKLLYDAQQKRPLSASEGLTLSRLYAKNGRPREAKTEMLKVINASPKAPSDALVAEFCQVLLNNKDFSEVPPWLQKLPEDSQVRIQLRLYLMAAQGQSNAVIQRLKQMIPKKITKENEDSLVAFARMFEQLAAYKDDPKLYNEAENLYRKYIDLRPDRRILLAMYLGRQGNVDDAIEICDQITKATGKPYDLQMIQAALSILDSNKGKLSPESNYFNTVRSWLDAALAAQPESSDLARQCGMLESFRGRDKEVEKIYTDYLARKDISRENRAVILNNYAYFLALRGSGDKALQLITKAIDILEPLPEFLDTRALAYSAKKNFKEARKDMSDYMKTGVTADKMFHLALIEQAAGNRRAAQEAYDTADTLGFDKERLDPQEKKLLDQLLKYLGDK